MTNARSLCLAATILVIAGCGDDKPEPRPETAAPSPVAPSRSAAELTGWPAGLGRFVVVRLSTPAGAYRLVVPELGDRRFADSAIAVKAGDSISVTLIGQRGKAGDATLLVVDAEAGSGTCVTWPSAEIVGARSRRTAAASAWRLAVERDSVVAIGVDSLLGASAADSSTAEAAVNAMLAAVPPAADSALRGIPFSTRRVYSFRVAGSAMTAAELTRASSSEADPREERLFVIGERGGADTQSYSLVYSRRLAGRADSTGMVDLLGVMSSRATKRGIIALAIEDPTGLRLQLIERVGRRRWRTSWSSAVSFC